MECAWNMYGIRMDYAWNMHGIRMGYAWSMHEHGRYMNGICRDCVWEVHGTCMEHSRDMHGICMGISIFHNTFHTDSVFIFHTYGICIRNVQGMYMEYVWNTCGVCMEYVWNMLRARKPSFAIQGPELV
jgi:hypothetical protein